METTDPQPSAGAYERWDALSVRLATSGASVTLQRDCRLHIAGYDILRVFAAMPSTILMRVEAVIDGENRVLTEAMPGRDTTCEYDMPLSGEWKIGRALNSSHAT